MNMRSIEMLWALVNEIPAPVVFWIAPPLQLAADVQEPPLPAIVKLPVVFVSKIPFVGPLAAVPAEMDVKPNVPPALARLTAVPVVVVTVTPFSTSAPVIVPLFVNPVDAPVLMSNELTVMLFPTSVTVPVSFGFVPEAIVSGPSVNVVPCPHSVWPAANEMVPVV